LFVKKHAFSVSVLALNWGFRVKGTKTVVVLPPVSDAHWPKTQKKRKAGNGKKERNVS
jgi:hypothetical protein